MATFRVGQRVRLIRCFQKWHGISVGTEAIIAGPIERALFGTLIGYPLSIGGIIVTNGAGLHLLAAPDQLEPIVDDGRQVVSWSECLWMPEHLRGWVYTA